MLFYLTFLTPYDGFLTKFYGTNLNGINGQYMWFQQDGAILYTVNETLDFLQLCFQSRTIS